MFTDSEIYLLSQRNNLQADLSHANSRAGVSRASAEAWRGRALKAESVTLRQQKEIEKMKALIVEQAKAIAALNALIEE